MSDYVELGKKISRSAFEDAWQHERTRAEAAEAEVERLRRQAERWESRARLASAASHSRAVIDQADNDTLRAELAELRVKWEQECANLEMAERRVEAVEAEVERLTRDRLDREATETDARERLAQAEERLAAVGELHAPNEEDR